MAQFAELGVVESVKVKGQVLRIEMPGNSEADQAIKAFCGKSIEGNHIKEKPAGSGGKSAHIADRAMEPEKI